MLPALYNNHKRIVQTEDTIVIQIEMVHETRIVRMNAEHDPAEIQKWLGDSIGRWEGDTLVVETTNFRDTPNFARGSANMKVTERFDYESPERVIYSSPWKTQACGRLPLAANTLGQRLPTRFLSTRAMKQITHWKAS